MSNQQFKKSVQSFKKQNGYAFSPDNKNAQMSESNIDRLALGIATFVRNQGGKAEIIENKQFVRTRTGFKYADQDERKNYCDVFIEMNSKKGCVAIGKDLDTAKTQAELANKKGVVKYFNAANMLEFKEWFSKNF